MLQSMFLKDGGECCHLHVFPKFEDNSLFMWFKQQLPWKAYPLNCGDILMSMHRPEERRMGNWVLTVTFQQSEALIDRKRRVI